MTIDVANLFFAYGGRPVLRDLSFRLEAGNLVALLGENGSGKSTLLSCLAGLRDISAVGWNGRPATELNRRQQARVRALVPQRPRYDPAMTLFDYVLLGRKPHFRWREGEKDQVLTQSMLEDFNLGNLAFRAMSDVSGGERQKAVLARAFVQDTPLLLLDEPLNNLDLRFQIEFMERLRNKARKEGALVIAALHDINAALAWCDAALLIRDGQLISSGTMDQALTEDSLEEMLGVRTRFTQVNGARQIILPGATIRR